MYTATTLHKALLTDRAAPIISAWLVALVILITHSSAALAETSNDQIETLFWGELHKTGGTTYYCNKSFDGKTPLIKASHIYPQGNIRQHLDCGTKRQCMRDSPRHNSIASDLHNLVPANSRFDMKRTNTIFGNLGAEIQANNCGIKRKMHVIEPPEHLKGDIARVIFYMHTQYELPMLGNQSVLEDWSKLDPPSEDEIARDIKIESLQNNNNPHVRTSIVKADKVTSR